MTTAAFLGTGIVKLVLTLVAFWLIWKAYEWAAEAEIVRAGRVSRMQDLEFYYAVAEYLEEREAKRGEAGPMPELTGGLKPSTHRLPRTPDADDHAFALDGELDYDELLMKRLERSVARGTDQPKKAS